jgi:hypothetical protein
MPPKTFTIDTERTVDEMHSKALWSYAIVVGEHPVIMKRANGQSFHMVYRTRHGASGGLGMAREQFPEAQVWEFTGA